MNVHHAGWTGNHLRYGSAAGSRSFSGATPSAACGCTILTPIHRSVLLCFPPVACLQLQRDTLQALQQQPSNLVASITSALMQQQAQQQALLSKQPQPATPQQPQQQQMFGSSTLTLQVADAAGASAGGPCLYCQGLSGDSSQPSFCCCAAGGPASLRAPSATAASTAHVALLLASWGYRVIVRKVVHSKAYWTKSMDNTFIVALDSSSGQHVEYIVDPHFQEAFNVGVISDNYRCVVFVCVCCAAMWP